MAESTRDRPYVRIIAVSAAEWPKLFCMLKEIPRKKVMTEMLESTGSAVRLSAKLKGQECVAISLTLKSVKISRPKYHRVESPFR